MLLERTVELDALNEVLSLVRSTGRGHLVLVAGEAGIGKTVLLREFVGGAGGVRVLSGACEALQTPRPLGPLLDIAAETGGELAAVVDAGAAPSDVLAALVEELRQRGPSIVVFEDLHWSDAATLDLLRLLARRMSGVPALVIATYRDDALVRHHPVRVALGELAPNALTRIALTPLTREAVAALAEPYDVDSAELHCRTGGNPFYVTEALAAGGATMPDTVRDAVLARAARLSPCARRLLDAVAVAPPRAELWLLEALADDDVQYLEECCASGMLHVHADAVEFRHEIARDVIAQALPRDRALALNRAALAALSAETRKVDLARLAHHAEAAGDADAVLRFATAAGERASKLGAHREAAAQYARALRFAEGEDRADLLERRSYECYLTAALGEAIEMREQALAVHQARGDRLREGDARRWLSRLWWYAGNRAQAEAEAAAAIELLQPLLPGRELAMAYSNMAQLFMLADDLQQAVVWGSRAIDLAEQLGETSIVVHALNNVGTAEHSHGLERGIAKLERSLALAREAGLEDDVARGYTNLAAGSIRTRRYALGAKYVEEAMAYFVERDMLSHLLYMTGWKARSQLDQGQMEEALATAEAVLADECAAAPMRIMPLIVVGLVRARTGNGDPWPPLDEALVLAEATAELQRLGPVAAARAEARWLAGDVHRIAGETDLAYVLAQEKSEPWAIGELQAWRRRAGIEDDVEPKRSAVPFRVELEGDLAAAADEWRLLGCPYETALLRLFTDDEASLRESLAAFQGLGAQTAAAHAARGLRERGARDVARGPRRSTRANPAGLTTRELEVLELLADGMRNAHIAERLVVSAKTVDHHVSAILRKLNVGSRTEAAAYASRLGLLER